MPRKPFEVIQGSMREEAQGENPVPPQPPASARRPLAKILNMAQANREEALQRWHGGTRLVQLRKSFGGRVPELEIVLMSESRRTISEATARIGRLQQVLDELRRRHRRAA